MLSRATKPSAPLSTDHVQERFVAVLPRIEAYASFCFRTRPHCYREELVAEVIAYSWRWFSGLMQRGKDPTWFLGTFTRYAVLAIKNGRSVGRSYRRKELWAAAARDSEVRIYSLENRCPGEENTWRDLLIEKRAFSPAEVAATRLDFAAWRERLPARSKEIADLLASGEQASAVAKKVRLSRARVTQLRRELAESWKAFQGESDPLGELGCARSLIPAIQHQRNRPPDSTTGPSVGHGARRG